MISYHTSVATNTGNNFSSSVAQRGNKHFQFPLSLREKKTKQKVETGGELDLYQQKRSVLQRKKAETPRKWLMQPATG